MKHGPNFIESSFEDVPLTEQNWIFHTELPITRTSHSLSYVESKKINARIFFRFPDERTGSPAELAVDVNGRCMGFRADQPNMIQPSKNNGTKFAFAIADIGVNIFGRDRHLIAKKSRFASLAEQTRFLEILADGFKAFPLPMPDGSKGGAGILLTPDCMEHMKSGDFVNGGLLEQLRYSEYWLKFKNTKIARFWLRS